MKYTNLSLRILPIALLAVVMVFAIAACKDTPQSEGKFVGLAAYMEQVKTAQFSNFKALPDAKVLNEAEFEKMKAHVLKMYDGVTAQHSFKDTDGRYVDCIPVAQQPSVRLLGIAPDQLDTQAPEPNKSEAADPSLNESEDFDADVKLRTNRFDQFDNEKYCPPGFIPMQRIELNDMIRFETLDNFFSKDGLGGGAELFEEITDRVPSHYYAHAYQAVNNYGGDSWLNLWNPTVATNQMSLSQQWYVGGSGAGLQTVEGGWQNYPTKYGNTKSRLFIYYTKANYTPGSGYYNLDGPGFVQTNNTIVLAGSFANYSVSGGTQYEFGMQWKRASNGNWWLYYKSGSTTTALGYYPKSLYGTGQLASFAQRADFGGETTGDPSSKRMGSGAFASAGWQYAAYQRNNFYINTSSASVWANLTPTSTPASCYTIAYTGPTGTGSWVEYFYYGGPSCY